VRSEPPRIRRRESRNQSRYEEEEHPEQPKGDQGNKRTKHRKEEHPKEARKQEQNYSRQPPRDQGSRQRKQPRAQRKEEYVRKQEALRDQEGAWQEVRRRDRKNVKKFKKRREIRKDKKEVLPFDEFLVRKNIQRITGFDFAKIVEKLIKYLNKEEVGKRAKREKRWTQKALRIRGSEERDSETLYGFGYESVEEPAEEGAEVQEKDMKSIPENTAQLAQQMFLAYCVKSEAARLLVFNLKARCDMWAEGLQRLEDEIKDKKERKTLGAQRLKNS
jgi:hypothetical protein